MSAKKKIHVTQIYRTLVQIIFFILLPGLYASTLLGLKTIYLGILNGNLGSTITLFSLVEIIAVIPITLLLGRFFCGWMCAFGAVSDWIYGISKRVFKIKFRVPEKVDAVLKMFKYVYLVILVVILWNVDWSFLDGSSPWDAFGYIFTVKSVPDIAGAIQYFAFGTILLLIILGLSAVIERFFCRYLCPLGAVFAIVSRLRIFKIKKVRDKCGACKICTNNCPMGIPMYKQDRISTGECIQCQRCTEVCPRQNAKLTIAEENVNTLVAGTLAVAAITSAYYSVDAMAGGSSTTTATSITQTTSGQYTDGTYTGTGTGFHNGTTTVSVTVENGYITDVEVVSYQDDQQYFQRAQSSVISQIIEDQTSDVDAVSGATFSSNGIMSAVEDALSGADGTTQVATATETTTDTVSTDTATTTSTDSTTTDATTSTAATAGTTDTTSAATATAGTADTTSAATAPTATASTATATTATASTTGTYTDGTYQGSGTGFRNGTTTVSVTVSGGLISDITVVSYQDDAPFFNRASSTVISEIINQQSSNVDAVSGATFSSNGIMSAVEDALSGAIA